MFEREPSVHTHAADWRALHAEGILWDSQIYVAGAGAELALRLIATNQRLAFSKGGAFVLDIPREWLDPAPYLHADGSIILTVDTNDGNRPEHLRLIVRDGRRLAVDLIASLKDSKPPLTQPATIFAPGSTDDNQVTAKALTGRPVPPWRVAPDPASTSLAALDADDFSSPAVPGMREAPDGAGEHHSLVEVARPVAAIPWWSRAPLAMTNRESRHARRGWAIRLSGLVLLLALAAVAGAGQLPVLPGESPGRSIDAPSNDGAPQATETPPTAELARVASTGVASAPVLTVLAGSELSSASQTAVSLGVGGEYVIPAASATETATASPAEQVKPSPTSRNVSIAAVETAVEQPTATREATALPAEPAPSATAAVQRTATPIVESSPTPTPVLVIPTVVPATSVPTAATAAPNSPTPSPAPAFTATPTPTPTPTPPPTPTPTATATLKVDFPAQAASLDTGELPNQAFASGAFRFTVEGVVRAPTIDDVALTGVAGSEWVLILIHVQNWSDQKASLAVADLQLLSYGAFGVQGSAVEPASGVVAEAMGLTPALGATDTAEFGAGRGLRLVLTFLVRPDSTVLQLTAGETTVDLGDAAGQPLNLLELGPEPPAPELIKATVTAVEDGATIFVESGGARTRVRYLGVQAPVADGCYAAGATAANVALVQGATVYLEREFNNREPGVGLVRDVWIVSSDGGLTLVSAELAAVGAVAAHPIEPDVRFSGWIRAAEAAARGSSAGLWGACGDLTTT